MSAWKTKSGMIKEIQLKLSPGELGSSAALHASAAQVLHIDVCQVSAVRIRRLSLDARSKVPFYIALVEVYTFPDRYRAPDYDFAWSRTDAQAPRVLIVGMGPAGLFAALTLVSAGVKPILIERGKPVRERKRDVAALGKSGLLDPDSNYGFGEGGAGCFSDGKLYTRSNKRGDISRVLRTFVHFGAKEEILYQAHPHLGSDRMPVMVERMRQYLLEAGAEIHFSTRIEAILCDARGRFSAVRDCNGNEYCGQALILATGNSAGEIYRFMESRRWALEEKPFAMGVRIEHPQELVDRMQYKGTRKALGLPPAEYTFAEQAGAAGVFSFCMCPGGVVIPAATEADGLVVNGMSDSGRNSPWANAGWVVTVNRSLMEQNRCRIGNGPLALFDFQQRIEREFFRIRHSFRAPAQRLDDFLRGRSSSDLPRTSYSQGIYPADMQAILPAFIAGALHEGLKKVTAKKPYFLSHEAILLGLESRTSSPIRIPRENGSFEHPDVKGLYPCGEGAGYAGGITSSAIDGMNCAEKILEKWNLKSNFGLPKEER